MDVHVCCVCMCACAYMHVNVYVYVSTCVHVCGYECVRFIYVNTGF